MTATTDSPRTSRSARRVSVLIGVAVAALVLAAALEAGGGAPAPPLPGIPDPGPLTGWGLPVLTLLNDLLAVGVAAGLLFPLLSTARVGGGRTMGRLSGARAAAWLATGWLFVILAWIWLSFSDQLAIPPGDVRWGEVWDFVWSISQGQALAVELVLVAILAVAARWAATFGQVLSLLVVTVLTFAPRVLTGHSTTSGNHDLALVALMVHVAAAGLWVAGVFALWFYLPERPDKQRLAAYRFGYLAVVSVAALAVSGVVSALVRVGGLTELFTSPYGALALVKVALLALLAWLGYRARSSLRDRLESPGRFARLASTELMLMGAAIAVGAALSRTAPPVGDIYVSTAESLIGGPLPPAPTPARLAWSYEPSGVGFLVVVGGVVMYVAALVALHRRRDRWPVWRTLSWFTGLLMVGYATFGGLGNYSHVLFSAHMGAHMVLGMVAPVFLVLGSPFTLLLRSLPGGPAPGQDGPRQMLAFILRSWPAKVVTNPFFVVPMFLVSLYGVYLTGFYSDVMMNHVGHAWMQAHFLISGYLLFELIIGNDPIPFTLPPVGQLLLMLGIAPLHAFFAVAVMDSTTVIGGQYYRLLDRPYRTDLLADQHFGGGFVWALGEVPTLLVAMALLGLWFTRDRRFAARFDRREDMAGDDSELAAYNRKLAAAAAHDRESATH